MKYNDTRFLTYVRSYRAPMTHAPRLNAPPMEVSGPFTLVPSDPGTTGSARPGVLVAVAAAIALAVLFGRTSWVAPAARRGERLGLVDARILGGTMSCLGSFDVSTCTPDA